MTYRAEIEELIAELRTKANILSSERAEVNRRRAEVLDFLINHPDDIKGVLDA